MGRKGDDHGLRGALIRDLPQRDRPRERLRDAGAPALSDAELIAILLRTGSSRESAIAQAQRLQRDLGLTGLRNATFVELCNIPGLGEAKAAQLKAALELGLRMASQGVEHRRRIVSPEDLVGPILEEMSGLPQEEVRVFLLDTRNRLISEHTVYKGSVHAAHVRYAELFRAAVRESAPSMALVHNHPSGDPTPSVADIQMTKQLCEAGRIMEIEVVDHVVVGGGKYTSINHLQPQLFDKTVG